MGPVLSRQLRIRIFVAAKAILIGLLLSQNGIARSKSKCPSFFNAFRYFGGPSPIDYVWSNGELSEAQWKNLVKFSKRAKKMPNKGAKIEIMDRNLGDQIYSLNTSVGLQKISRNGPYENHLLARSDINSKPKEILNFRLHLENGDIVETPIWISGNADTVNFEKGEFELFRYVRGNMGGIRTVEIAHTHPTYEVIITDGPNRRVRSNEVSLGDIQTALEFAQRISRGKEVLVKAIVPNGYHYELRLPTGR